MRRTFVQVALLLALCLSLTAGALAMSSPAYRLDWMVPLSGGGGRSASTNYVAQITIGQPVSGRADGVTVGACWGFWCGISAELRTHLPFVAR